jgi:hypothetical protein
MPHVLATSLADNPADAPCRTAVTARRVSPLSPGGSADASTACSVAKTSSTSDWAAATRGWRTAAWYSA